MVCSICLEDIQRGQAVHLSCCKNTFCPECLFKWFAMRPSCPLCRSESFCFRGAVRPGKQPERVVPVKEALRLAAAGTVLAPLILASSPVQGPELLFLVFFAALLRHN